MTLPLAHMVFKGIGEIGNGAVHPFVTPPHLLIILALALLIGQRQPLTLKWPLIALASASAIALALTTTGWLPAALPQPLIIAIALAIATLVAIGRQLPTWIYPLCAALAALAIGLDSAVAPDDSFATLKTLLGTWLALTLATPYLAIATSNAVGKPWAQIAVRIAASWIIAIALMVLAFALKK